MRGLEEVDESAVCCYPELLTSMCAFMCVYIYVRVYLGMYTLQCDCMYANMYTQGGYV